MTEPYEWAVVRPDGWIFRTDESEARAYVSAGNADGSSGYRLVRRPVAPWQDVTDGDPSQLNPT